MQKLAIGALFLLVLFLAGVNARLEVRRRMLEARIAALESRSRKATPPAAPPREAAPAVPPAPAPAVPSAKASEDKPAPVEQPRPSLTVRAGNAVHRVVADLTSASFDLKGRGWTALRTGDEELG